MAQWRSHLTLDSQIAKKTQTPDRQQALRHCITNNVNAFIFITETYRRSAVSNPIMNSNRTPPYSPVLSHASNDSHQTTGVNHQPTGEFSLWCSADSSALVREADSIPRDWEVLLLFLHLTWQSRGRMCWEFSPDQFCLGDGWWWVRKIKHSAYNQK